MKLIAIVATSLLALTLTGCSRTTAELGTADREGHQEPDVRVLQGLGRPLAPSRLSGRSKRRRQHEPGERASGPAVWNGLLPYRRGRRLLRRRARACRRHQAAAARTPKAKGIAVPGMPAGSPGMEVPSGRVDAYDVFLVGPMAPPPSTHITARPSRSVMHRALILGIGCLSSFNAAAASIDCERCEAWNQEQAPFQIFGNTYFVGVRGLSAVLVTSPDGHVLIDGALPQSAPLIARHVKQLGFKMSDVKVILNSHVHYDHAGGIAELQKLSGAKVIASDIAAKVLRTGKVERNDPQFGDHQAIPGREERRSARRAQVRQRRQVAAARDSHARPHARRHIVVLDIVRRRAMLECRLRRQLERDLGRLVQILAATNAIQTHAATWRRASLRSRCTVRHPHLRASRTSPAC